MLSLILWRHAKSSWEGAGIADHDRPLNARGNRAAPLVASLMKERDILPRRILCSTALRARETLAALLGHLRRDTDIALRRDIYEAGPQDLLDLIRRQPDVDGALMVIGHNPTFEDLAATLIAPAPLAEASSGSVFPTAAAALIAFDADDWGGIAPGGGRLEMFVRPRDLET